MERLLEKINALVKVNREILETIKTNEELMTRDILIKESEKETGWTMKYEQQSRKVKEIIKDFEINPPKEILMPSECLKKPIIAKFADISPAISQIEMISKATNVKKWLEVFVNRLEEIQVILGEFNEKILDAVPEPKKDDSNEKKLKKQLDLNIRKIMGQYPENRVDVVFTMTVRQMTRTRKKRKIDPPPHTSSRSDSFFPWKK